MGAIGVLLGFEKLPESARLGELHRALWTRIHARLDGALVSGLTRNILVHYIGHEANDGFESGRLDSLGHGVTFSFRDGGDDFPLKYASHHWTDRACVDPVVFADLQAIARQYGAELRSRPWYPPETVYFPLDEALVGVYADYLDVWTGGGLVRVGFDECPFVEYVKKLKSEQRCWCEVCRKPTDQDERPVFDAETLAGIASDVEVTDASELFARLEEALEDSDLPLPIDEIASLTGVARRKAELSISMGIENDSEDMRVPTALVTLRARWAAPVLFPPAIHETTSSDARETLRESMRALIAMPKPPIVTTGHGVDADGVSILVLRFVGEYVDESDATNMRADTDALLDLHGDAVGIVLDATELWYAAGKGLDGVVRKGRPRAWATSAPSRGLYDFIESERGLSPQEWLYPSIDDAIAAVRALVVADGYEIRAADGTTVVETARREPRGRRHHVEIEEAGEKIIVSTLFDLHGAVIEVVRRRADGSVQRLVEYPVRDARGDENDACRVGGQLTSWGGIARKVEYNPRATGLPLPTDWVERVATHPTIDRVSLDDTGVATAEILRLLERCPRLDELYLNKLRLDAELFDSPLFGTLHRLQVHGVEAPHGAIARLAALHPWLDIEPRPAAPEHIQTETPSAAPKPPVATSGRSLDADGVAILVVSFVGEYDAENAARMKRACDALLAEHPDTDGIVLDATQLAYAAGEEIGAVVGEARPWGWVVSAASRGLFDFIRIEQKMEPRQWLFPSVDDAIAAVRGQVVADSYPVHTADRGIWHTWKREPRGRRSCGMRLLDEGRVAHEKLYGPRGRLVEEIYRRSDGTVSRSVEWPVRDAAGAENAACRLGARLITVEGRLRTIDYDVAETKLPLPHDWVARVAAHPTVDHVGLDHTGVATTKILELLERCPQIRQLALNSLTLDAELFASPLLANLTWLGVWNAVTPAGALKQLAATYPTIDIVPKSALV